MLQASAIAPPTLQAYLETDYRVHGEPGFTLGVGRASAELLAAHKRRRTDCSAFLTACNPFSQPLDTAANAARQAALAKELSGRSLAFVPGVGQHFVDGVLGKDITLVMGVVLVYSTLMVVFNLVVDVMYRFVDPRIG